MKVLIFLALAQLYLSSPSLGDTCGSVIESLETTCQNLDSLTLVSSPNNHRVDGSNCDTEYNKAEWQEQPTLSYHDAKPDKTYVLLNIDPDPKGYQKGEYWLHWLVSNISGEDLKKGDLSKANHLTVYRGPGPPKGTGIHRYMFLVFEEGENNQKVEGPSTRASFKLGPWLKSQHSLCGPVAGIQFRTQF